MLKFLFNMNNWELMGISQVIDLFPTGHVEEDGKVEKVFKVIIMREKKIYESNKKFHFFIFFLNYINRI